MPELVLGSSYEPDIAEPDIRILLGRAGRMTAVFTASDDLAIRLYELAREIPLRIPDDLAIVGYGNLDMAPYLGLSTVCQQPEEIGRAAIQCFVERIQSREAPPRTIVVPTRLLVRESSGVARS